MADVNFTSVEVNRSNEPILVPANVKYNPVSDFIGHRKSSPQFAKIPEIGGFNYPEPTNQSRFTIGMLFPKLAQCFT